MRNKRALANEWRLGRYVADGNWIKRMLRGAYILRWRLEKKIALRRRAMAARLRATPDPSTTLQLPSQQSPVPVDVNRSIGLHSAKSTK